MTSGRGVSGYEFCSGGGGSAAGRTLKPGLDIHNHCLCPGANLIGENAETGSGCSVNREWAPAHGGVFHPTPPCRRSKHPVLFFIRLCTCRPSGVFDEIPFVANSWLEERVLDGEIGGSILVSSVGGYVLLASGSSRCSVTTSQCIYT